MNAFHAETIPCGISLGVPALQRLACTAALIAASAASAFADGETSVTPYRPTVSTPAALSAPAWVEVELGVLQAQGNAPSRRDSLPFAVKLAFSDDWGIRLGGELWVRDVGRDGRNIDAGGDTAIVAKRRFAVNEQSAFGLEAGVMLPTAPAGLHIGSGRADYGLNAIYSRDFAGAFHTDINVGLTRLGLIDPTQSRDLALGAAAVSYAVNPRWGLAGEWSGTYQRGAGATAQGLLAATYSPIKRVTWDFGIARGLTIGTPAWTFFAGTTFLLSHF